MIKDSTAFAAISLCRSAGLYMNGDLAGYFANRQVTTPQLAGDNQQEAI